MEKINLQKQTRIKRAFDQGHENWLDFFLLTVGYLLDSEDTQKVAEDKVRLGASLADLMLDEHDERWGVPR